MFELPLIILWAIRYHEMEHSVRPYFRRNWILALVWKRSYILYYFLFFQEGILDASFGVVSGILRPVWDSGRFLDRLFPQLSLLLALQGPLQQTRMPPQDRPSVPHPSLRPEVLFLWRRTLPEHHQSADLLRASTFIQVQPLRNPSLGGRLDKEKTFRRRLHPFHCGQLRPLLWRDVRAGPTLWFRPICSSSQWQTVDDHREESCRTRRILHGELCRWQLHKCFQVFSSSFCWRGDHSWCRNEDVPGRHGDFSPLLPSYCIRLLHPSGVAEPPRQDSNLSRDQLVCRIHLPQSGPEERLRDERRVPGVLHSLW